MAQNLIINTPHQPFKVPIPNLVTEDIVVN